MPYIVIRERQPLDLVARRFRRICEKDGLFKRMNILRNYKKPSEMRKLEKAIAKKRAYRRLIRDNPWMAPNNRSHAHRRSFSLHQAK